MEKALEIIREKKLALEKAMETGSTIFSDLARTTWAMLDDIEKALTVEGEKKTI